MSQESRQTRPFPFGQAVVWEPDPAWMAASNLQQFMTRHGIASYDELCRRATADIGWFWQAALEDLGIEFYQPYNQIVDLSAGVELPRWC
ncbi:hypothetical protein RY27_06345, partial [Litorilinea aerophila]